jgi:sugar lactone lactonase YvrE
MAISSNASLRVARSLKGAIVLVGFALAACSGGSPLPQDSTGRLAGAPSAPFARRSPGNAEFLIVVPRKKKQRRGPAYLSQGTKSLKITVTSSPSGTIVIDATANLTPQSPGCSTTPAGTQCLLSYRVSGGNYIATVNTYDGLSGSGTLLSSAQKVAFSVTRTTTQVNLRLDGIPRSLAVTSGSYAVLGRQSTGFTLYGASAQPLLVTALDADGFAIVGGGAPSFTAIASGTGWSIGSVRSGSSSFPVVPPVSNGSAGSVKFTAHYTDPTVCAQAGAVCTATVAIANHLQRLFVANGDSSTAQMGNVTIYDPPYSGTPLTITSGTSEPQVLLLDPSQNLFVGQCDSHCGHSSPDRVEEYAPPYTAAPSTTITTSVAEMLGMTMDTSKNLFVSYYSLGAIGIYAPPYTGTPSWLSGLSNPTSMVLGPTGTLYAANSSAPSVSEYPLPYMNTPGSISNGVENPNSIVMDAAQNLFVSNNMGDNVTVYAPPYSGAPKVTIPVPSNPGAIALDASGDLFVLSPLGNAVYVYAPPYSRAPVSITTNVYFPLALAVDDVGNLFVANSSNNSVVEFAPPYAGAPTFVRTGVKVPQSLVLSP